MEHSHHPKIADHDAHHDHPHEHVHRGVEKKRLTIVAILTGSMMVVEGIGGYVTNSLALLSDAFHMLTHFGALMISLSAIIIATRFQSEDKTFGYWRAEILTALLNGITLVPIVGYILYESYQRYMHPEPIRDTIMLVVALVGLIVNIVSALALWGVGREDINIRGAFLHMIGDTLSSVAVIIAGLIIYFTNWVVVDPIASVVISIMILIWSAGLIYESVHVLLESVPKGIKIDEVEQSIRAVPMVKDVHDIHIWQITSGMYSMTCHAIVEDMSISGAQHILKQ
ncbi:MAG TPA: cation diffusion facilitator family transporter, partial [Nitrospirota bacterium]|nr:cation diffusion facilitator family transporter [Nitrospirota bacterium]